MKKLNKIIKNVADKYKKVSQKITYSYGNDIEFHVFDKIKNKMVSAIDVLNGRDKYNPIDLGDGIMCYHDNILIETSFPPYYSKDEMFNRLETVIGRIHKLIGDNYELVPHAAHVYDKEALTNPKALESGCSVNFNAYTVAPNPPTQFKGGLRSAGFHCHVGSKNEILKDFNTKINTVKALDIYLGVASVIFNPDKTEINRRKIYGRSSEHRPCDAFNGFEYRPLSPGILRSRETTELAFDLFNYTLKQVEDNKLEEILSLVDSKDVQCAIDNCDVKLAKQVLSKAKLPKDLMNRVTKKYKFDFKSAWGLK